MINKIISEKYLPTLVHNLKKRNQKVGFTNGAFDILHRGHVEYLNTAAEKVDVLIVGLNSDNSIKNIKGANRPINDQADRAAILSSLYAVDYVIIFNDLTVDKLLKTILPDIYFKGGDYKPQDINEYKTLIRLRIKIEVSNFAPHVSTSKIIEKIRAE